MDDLSNERPPSPPPRLRSWLERDLERLQSIGGPIFANRSKPPTALLLGRISLSWEDIQKPLLDYTYLGADWAWRHWPWAAISCHFWRVQNEKSTERSEFALKPSEVRATLQRIERNARQIADDLATLDQSSLTLLPHERLKAGHIAWLTGFIYVAQDYNISIDTYREADQEKLALQRYSSRAELYERIARLGVAAQLAAESAERDLLAVRTPGSDAGLVGFVSELADLWHSLTGRKPSVNKVPSRVDDPRPDFVLFVQSLADVQIRQSAERRPWASRESEPFPLVAPTYAQIAGAFAHTSWSAKK